MGKHKHRSRSPEDFEDTKSYREKKHKKDKSYSRSPSDRRHKHKEEYYSTKSSSKWENNSPDRDRERRRYRDHREDRFEESRSRREDRYRGDNSGKYERDREENRERKMHHRRRNNRNEDDGKYDWGKRSDDDNRGDKEADKEKEKPNFGLSGKLAEDTNKVNGVVIKYAEPPEARIPKKRWRLYPFKGEKSMPTLYIHRQSCYLIGRDRKIVDIPVDHPSCSKQHAALQYRLMPYEKDDGTAGKRVLPYIIDLESANGTFLNNKQIEAKKYYQVMEKDVIKFGFSTREYVLLHEFCKDEENDDTSMGATEVKEEPNEIP